jgi:hypothetical protein
MHPEAEYYCETSALRAKTRALFTKARISSSKALLSCSGAFISPRLAAMASKYSGRAISISSSCRSCGCIHVFVKSARCNAENILVHSERRSQSLGSSR